MYIFYACGSKIWYYNWKKNTANSCEESNETQKVSRICFLVKLAGSANALWQSGSSMADKERASI